MQKTENDKGSSWLLVIHATNHSTLAFLRAVCSIPSASVATADCSATLDVVASLIAGSMTSTTSS